MDAQHTHTGLHKRALSVRPVNTQREFNFPHLCLSIVSSLHKCGANKTDKNFAFPVSSHCLPTQPCLDSMHSDVRRRFNT